MPRLHPQSSAPEFGPSSVLGPGTCFKAYNLIQSQDAWLELKSECFKKLVKKFSLLPPSSPLLLTTSGAKAIRAQKEWNIGTKVFEKKCTTSEKLKKELNFESHCTVNCMSVSFLPPENVLLIKISTPQVDQTNYRIV